MKTAKFFFLFLGLYILGSCHKNEIPVVCGCRSEEVIGFEEKQVTMKAAGDSVQVHFNTPGWGIWALKWNDTFTVVQDKSLRERLRFDFYAQHYRLYRPDAQTLRIYMYRNPGPGPRTLGIYIQSGNCHAVINVKQQAP